MTPLLSVATSANDIHYNVDNVISTSTVLHNTIIVLCTQFNITADVHMYVYS